MPICILSAVAIKRDYYDVLGVPREASDEHIKRAFRKLAQQHHPDIDLSAGADERFKELNEAYRVLSDRQRRTAYDMFGHAGVEGGGGGTPGFQPVTSPASESNRNNAGPLAAPAWTTNPGVGLKTCPVGAPPGMFTTSGALLMGLPLTKPG